MSHEIFLNGKAQLCCGDSLHFLKDQPDNRYDSVVTDPPYALVSIGKRFGADGAAAVKVPEGGSGAYARASAGFMGKRWDTGETAFAIEFWQECLRVLKPGGHVVAFGGTRTYHRLACAIEDAGFEIRDQLQWIYGSGFPKSHDVSKGIDKAAGAEREIIGTNEDYLRRKPNGMKTAGAAVYGYSQSQYETDARITAPATDSAVQWQGWGTALKPSAEPICLARKPLIGTVAANVIEHGTGAINIDGCRVPAEGEALGGGRLNGATPLNEGWDRPWMHDETRRGSDAAIMRAKVAKAESIGRWPANIIHDGSDEVIAAFPDADGAVSNSRSKGKNSVYGEQNASERTTGHGDLGSAARFFYQVKQDETCPEPRYVDPANACDDRSTIEAKSQASAQRLFYSSKADADDRLGSKHPTVKPVDLMQWLVRLVTPKGGLVLDPFAGTGTTAEACFREGMRCMLVERETEYQADIRRRMALVLGGPEERRRESIKAKTKDQPIDHGPLFAASPNKKVPAHEDATPSAPDLLARLRGKMRPMNIPKLTAEEFE